jgi:hypothetical protein
MSFSTVSSINEIVHLHQDGLPFDIILKLPSNALNSSSRDFGTSSEALIFCTANTTETVRAREDIIRDTNEQCSGELGPVEESDGKDGMKSN